MKKLNKNVIWWVLVLSISFWTIAYWTTTWTLWILFKEINWTYYLMWSTIEPDTVTEDQMSNSFKAIDSFDSDNADKLDNYDSTYFQRKISNSSCVYGIKSIADNWTKICALNNDTDTQLSETTVENYIANDISINYVPKDNGTKLVNSSIYDNWNVWIWTINPSQQLHTTWIARFDWGVQVGSKTVIDNVAWWHISYWSTWWKNWTYGGWWYMQDSTWMRVLWNKPIYTANEVRATIFKDANNVWYYLDPSSTSNLNIVQANAFIYSSDRRLKKNIYTLNNSIKKINKLRWVSFNWKENGNAEIGLIAQEVESIYPDLVVTDNKWMKAVKYGNIVAILIEGMKELYSSISWNSTKISDLENKINILTEKLNNLEKLIK